MPAKKAAKSKPVTKPSPPEERPTPRVAEGPAPASAREVEIHEVPVGDTNSHFVKNYLWPTVCALGLAVITALGTNAPGIVADGIQPGDWGKLLSIAGAAAAGFLANILTRYGGRGSPFFSPTVQPREKA